MRNTYTEEARVDSEHLARIAEHTRRIAEEGPIAAAEEWEQERLERIAKRAAKQIETALYQKKKATRGVRFRHW
jgi:hypothetical protein